MTKITGIIAEFNPFHNGHQYLLDQASGVKIVAMSGNWVQRGEPAIFDKWTRAEMALRCGADLVVELPTTVSVQAADFFAAGSVKILANLGIDTLLFGSESDTDYNLISKIYAEKSVEMQKFLANLPQQLSYPEKTQMMWEKFSNVKFDGNTPNHVLALAYAKACARRQIVLQPVRRLGEFHSLSLSAPFVSATAIRKGLLTGFSVNNGFPSALIGLYEHPKTSWSAYFPLLKYKIISSVLTEIHQMNQELEIRIKLAAREAQSFEELVELTSTKRYTKARVRRLLTYILLNISRDFAEPERIHVLGFTKQGQKILAQAKDKVLTKIGQRPWDTVTQKSDEIYRLGNSELQEQNYGRKPIILP
ncbi:MAG: nucleotidyltransferase [Streptococcaceae bacterium]|nr:nucleotidyltransferase [Streptococcaceae bacterium]